MSLQTFFANFPLLADAPNGVAKLRELILRLAVRGKLVPQNSNEEPSAALIARGLKTKKRSAISFSIADRPHEIPSSWNWVRFEDIVDFEMGKTPSTKASAYWDDENSGVAWVSIADMPIAGTVTKTAKRVSEKAISDVFKRAPVAAGTLLMSFKLSIGKVAFLDMEAYHNEAIISIYPFAPEIKQYLYHCLRGINLLTDSNNAIKGNTLNSTSLKAILIPLPPLEEQKRIVAKVDELMRLCDELEARQQASCESRVRLNKATLAPLNNVASLAPEEFEQAYTRLADNFAVLYDSAETVGRLRSTILQLAMQGKLVPQEPKDEPAPVLLKRIRKEKDQLIKEKKIKQDKPMPPLTEEDGLFTLPNGWEWVRLNELCSQITDGVHSTPAYTLTGIPFLSVNNLKDNKISFEGCKRISPVEHQQLIKRCKPEQGDVLLGKVGSIGVCDVIATEAEFSIFVQLALIKPLQKFVNSYYIKQSLLSETVKEQIFSGSAGSALQYIGIGKIQMLVIPLPPLEEQKRIVAKVNQLMALCDELETKLRQAEADSEKLMKAAVRDLLASISEAVFEILKA